MAYSDDAQSPEGSDNPGLLTITMVVVAGLVLIVGCLGIYFFVGRSRPTNAQGITVIQITKIPSATPSLTPTPTLTPVAVALGGTGGGEGVPTPNLAATAQAAPAGRSVTLSEIRGSVLIKNDIVTDWTMVTTEVNIPQGTMILTNENSTVKIGFIEGAVLRLGPQTQVTLMDVSGTTVDPVTKFQLDSGRVWAVVGDAMGLGRFQIVTPLGMASVVGTFMGVEHNSNGPLDIITCLEGHCRYANASGVQDLFTDQQLESDGPGVPHAPHAMDANQLADWSLTKVPEVITLTPTRTATATLTNTRTPTHTHTPSQTPNAATGIAASTNSAAAATGNAQATYNAATATANAIDQTATQNSINVTGTVFYFDVTSTAIAASTSSFFTSTVFARTATPVFTPLPTSTVPPPATPGPAAKLAFIVQPSYAIAGVPIRPKVQVAIQDAMGRTVLYATNTITIALGTNPNSGALAGTLTVGPVNGVATFPNLSINKSGRGYTLVASSTGLAGVTSATFNVIPASAASLVISGLPTTVIAGTPQSITVTANDAFGNIATGYTGTVTFTSTDAGAVLPPDYPYTASDNGVKTFIVTFNTMGNQSVTVTDTVTSTITGSASTTVN